MNIALSYECPKCEQDAQVDAAQMNQLIKEGSISCVSCKQDLSLDENGTDVLNKRHNEIKSIQNHQLLVSSCLFGTTLLHFSGFIPLAGLIIGYAIAAFLYMFSSPKQFEDLDLTFHEPAVNSLFKNQSIVYKD
ncbi:hypothetical protein BS333_20610 [Vibrio azureus]|nr:hypothetical protein [Vibrio azureus]AUI88690.1 hypothetical protein BS333_20610 [Vibrio azureus]